MASTDITVALDNDTGKYRLMDPSTGKVALNAAGTPFDGGGQDFQDKAVRQAGYINAAAQKKRESPTEV